MPDSACRHWLPHTRDSRYVPVRYRNDIAAVTLQMLRCTFYVYPLNGSATLRQSSLRSLA
jgi:hypothetical protein